jgi:hypothetical protein
MFQQLPPWLQAISQLQQQQQPSLGMMAGRVLPDGSIQGGGHVNGQWVPNGSPFFPGMGGALNSYGAGSPDVWRGGGVQGGGFDPLALYNYAVQNMPQWAVQQGVTPEAYAAWLMQNQGSQGWRGFQRSQAQTGAPAPPVGYGDDMVTRPLPNTTQVFPAPPGPRPTGPSGMSPAMVGALLQGSVAPRRQAATALGPRPAAPGPYGALQRRPPAFPSPPPPAPGTKPYFGPNSSPSPAGSSSGSPTVSRKPYYPGNS